jgi:hypothetical protein
MASSKLMEAAADILSGSKKSAPAMPPEKLTGEVVDIGGPTPQNYKQDDDSAKLDTTKAVGDKSGHNQSTIKMKPSAASGKTVDSMHKEDINLEDFSLEELEEFMVSEEYEQLDELSKSTLGSYVKKASKDAVTSSSASTNWARTSDRARNPRVKAAAAQYSDEEESREKKRLTGIGKAVKKLTKEQFNYSNDIDSLFDDDSTISEEFKTKATTIFETRVYDRVSQIQEQMETEFAGMLEEAVETIKEDLTAKVDDYLNYVVEQWLEQNEIAIESGLRSELTEEFIAGLRNLFAEHYIDVPAEKVDLVGELAEKVEELEGKLNEEIERSVELKKSLVESRKVEITHAVCEGLTATQVEKIKSLAESVDYSTEEEYQDKLETIRENYFPSGVKKATVGQLHEQVEDSDDKRAVITDPFVAAVSQAISKTKL